MTKYIFIYIYKASVKLILAYYMQNIIISVNPEVFSKLIYLFKDFLSRMAIYLQFELMGSCSEDVIH